MDLDLLIKGFSDGLSGEKLLMSDDDLRKTMSMFQNELRRKQNEIRRKQAEMKQKQMKTTTMTAEDNKKAGDAFLAENKTKEGVVTLPSGLQYRILKAGDGKKPSDADTVECHYRGTLINGTEFAGELKSLGTHPRLEGSDEAHARGFQVADLYPPTARLW